MAHWLMQVELENVLCLTIGAAERSKLVVVEGGLSGHRFRERRAFTGTFLGGGWACSALVPLLALLDVDTLSACGIQRKFQKHGNFGDLEAYEPFMSA